MALELVATALQTVEDNDNVMFTDEVVSNKGCQYVYHRDGSGLITMRAGAQNRGRYKVSFGANVGLPADGTIDDPIRLALAINGEGVPATAMISTPAAVEEFNNVFGAIFLDVPCGCCYQVSVKNLSGQAIDVQNANLIIERVA